HRAFQRFFDVPEGTGFDCGNRALFAAFAGDNDRRNIGEFGPELAQQIQAVHAGQFDIGDQSVRLVAAKSSQGVFRIAYAQYLVAPALEQLFVTLPRVLFVFYDQHAILALGEVHRAYRRLFFVQHSPNLSRETRCRAADVDSGWTFSIYQSSTATAKH